MIADRLPTDLPRRSPLDAGLLDPERFGERLAPDITCSGGKSATISPASTIKMPVERDGDRCRANATTPLAPVSRFSRRISRQPKTQ